MSLKLTKDSTIFCDDCKEEMLIQRLAKVGSERLMLHVAPDGLSCPFCSKRITEQLREAVEEMTTPQWLAPGVPVTK